ncbi:MAG TPA: uroporphyrinogen-III C-methyltransferase [Sphingobacterium sp.]|nr:uroporphyrinogen-III C-methyltransferase [Sphingobacterium sp.]
MKTCNKKLFIVGSGPGNVDLLTVKSLRIIKKAQVVLYDNLVSAEILKIIPKDCITCYVGKDPYGAYVSQQKIHDFITHYCGRYDRVVRLKGGDPYIFGRGFEEWMYAKQIGIEVEYVPGISSMQGVGMSEIPLTHRGTSDGVWALTAMKQDGSFSKDLQLAVQSRSTIVIYMGMRKLDEIARMFVLYGKGDTPAAIVQHATLPRQKQALCKVADLVSASQEHALGHPAIIVIGEVVNLQYARTLAAKDRCVV